MDFVKTRASVASEPPAWPPSSDARGRASGVFPRSGFFAPGKLPEFSVQVPPVLRQYRLALPCRVVQLIMILLHCDLPEGLAVARRDRMTSWPYSRSCRTASIRSGRAGGLAGELGLSPVYGSLRASRARLRCQGGGRA